MRILFLSNLYPPHSLGGMELRCKETVNHLQARGHSCHVLTSRYGIRGEPPLEEGITRALDLQADVHYYRPLDFFLRRPSRERANRRALRRVLDSFKPDIVFVWGMWNLSRGVAYWAEQWMPGRVAYAVASYWLVEPDAHERYWQRPPRHWRTSMFLGLPRRFALHTLAKERTTHLLALENVACVSDYVRRKLSEAEALPHGARVIYNGIDPQPFLDAGTGRASHLEGMRLIYTGGILPHKGVHTAIEAMGLLRQRGKADHLHLTLVGDGHPDYEAHLHELVTRLGLDAKVTFLGRVTRDEIPNLLTSAEVFLFTSLWEEPIARSVMEAMASGLTVVGTAVGGQKEMLREGTNALVFAPGDAEGLAAHILQLYHDPDLRVRLAAAGRTLVVEKFTLERMVDEIETWLSLLL